MLNLYVYNQRYLNIIKCSFFIDGACLYIVNRALLYINIYCILILEKYLLDFFFRGVFAGQNNVSIVYGFFFFKKNLFLSVLFFINILFLFFFI